MRAFFRLTCLSALLAGCLAQPADLENLLDEFSASESASAGGSGVNSVVQGINAATPAGQEAPEISGELTLVLIGANRVPADVTVSYWVLDIEVRHTEVQIPDFAGSLTIGPDRAT